MMHSAKWTASNVSTRVVLLLIFFISACTSITGRHDPLYRAEPHTSDIRATAENSVSGIVSISIEVTAGRMTDCSEFAVAQGMKTRSIIPCRIGATVTTNTCTFSGAPAVATCTATIPIQSSTLVSYVVSAVSGSGQTTTAPEIAYAGGTQTQQRVARPVYWHRKSTRGPFIELGLFPDSDYSAGVAAPLNPYRQFTDHLDSILGDVFFNTTDPIARTYTGNRRLFNLWAGPFGANSEGCARTFTGDAQSVSAVMDGSAILHRNDFTDCGSISAGGAGSVQATLSDPSYVLVHESGHFLFALSDEYAAGGHVTTMPCNNNYASQTACQAAAPAVGAATAQCQQMGTTGIWRIATADETMADRSLASDFRDDSAQCVANRFKACDNGSCY